MQLRRAAYNIFESRRNVDHFITLSFCKADTGFPSRGGGYKGLPNVLDTLTSNVLGLPPYMFSV